MQSAVVIDADGREWSAESPAFAAHLGGSLQGGELLDYAVINCGHVHIRQHHGRLSIRYRPDIVSPLALTSLLFWTDDYMPSGAIVSMLREDWEHRIWGSYADIQNAIREALELAQRNPHWRFAGFQRRLATEATSRLNVRRHLRIWQDRLRTVEEPRALAPQLDFAFSGNFALYSLQNERQRIAIEAVGQIIHQLDSDWAVAAPGRSMREFDDSTYGEWIDRHLLDAVHKPDMTFDEIDAVVRWRSSGPVRRVYARALVPVQRPDGSHLLLGVTQPIRASA